MGEREFPANRNIGLYDAITELPPPLNLSSPFHFCPRKTTIPPGKRLFLAHRLLLLFTMWYKEPIAMHQKSR